jgi:hypothetical protein
MSSETSGTAARERSRVAFVTCEGLPGIEHDDQPLADALAARGVTVTPAVWTDTGVDWAAFDLVVLRSPWDYPDHRDAFVAWARSVPRLANPADVVAWNTDKTYLRELADAGIAVVPTVWAPPGSPWTPDTDGVYVVKPTISAGSRDTGRYDLADPAQRTLAAAHVTRLTDAGRTAMVQPYLSAVDTAGETAVLCTPDAAGRLSFSHGIRKGPMLTGPDRGVEGLYLQEKISARVPTPAELAAAQRVLAAVPGGADRLLYARVDLIPGPDGEPVLLELELTEPSLFLTHVAGAADRLADAVADRLRAGIRPPVQPPA